MATLITSAERIRPVLWDVLVMIEVQHRAERKARGNPRSGR
jgi:hypothetical protein